jgi:hypothetical protein
MGGLAAKELERFAAGIANTGFVLENQIVQQLRDAGWTVISNRYYEDDLGGTVREIDVLAYRVTNGNEFDVYTCLIVSCKKSKENVWAFLARDINLKDPNSDWWPVHAWSNVRSLDYQLTAAGIARRYHNYVGSLGVEQALRVPPVEVFAFQELNRRTGACDNQKAIFGALTTLLKSQSYEMGALARRKTTPCVYQFNLVSVVESEMVRLTASNAGIVAAEIDDEQLISSYIIKGRQSFSRVRFLTAGGFRRALPEYGKLHDANCVWFDLLNGEFYVDILRDESRRNVLNDRFQKELNWKIHYRILAALRRSVEVGNTWFSFDSNKTLQVNISGDEFDDAITDFLCADVETKNNVASALKKVYRYEGAFALRADDIPF